MADEELMTEEIAEASSEDGSKISDTVPENETQEEEIAGKDYGAIERADVEELKKEFPELSGISHITELENPLRYGALRDLGLSPSEAYLATHGRKRISDNRYHLFASPAISASAHGAISEKEMEAARDIFPDISDKEIRKLYKKVTSNERKNYV